MATRRSHKAFAALLLCLAALITRTHAATTAFTSNTDTSTVSTASTSAAAGTTSASTSTASTASATTSAASSSTDATATTSATGGGASGSTTSVSLSAGTTTAATTKTTTPSLVKCYNHKCSGSVLDEDCLERDLASTSVNVSTCFSLYCKVAMVERHFIRNMTYECVNSTCEFFQTSETSLKAGDTSSCCSASLCNEFDLLAGAVTSRISVIWILAATMTAMLMSYFV